MTIPRLLACLVVALGVCGAQAQSWPSKPISIVVPFGPGGNTDTLARLAAAQLAKALNATVVVDNRPGSAGLIAARQVLAAPADGHTLFMATATQLVTAPFINPNFTFDPLKDFAPVVNVGANPFVLTAKATLPAKNVSELVALARQQPGKLTYGSGGNGALTHLSAYLFAQRAEIDLVHVPYKGAAPALADLIGGSIDLYSASPSEVIPHATSGKIRLLAVSSAMRLKELPTVPTLAETFPGHEVTTWNGLVAKAGTPAAVLDRIAAEVAKLKDDPVAMKKLEDAGVTPLFTTRATFGAQLQREVDLWGRALRHSGIKAE